jgi:chromosome segregation ATPase
MIIKHKGKKYDDQIGSGKLGKKIKSGIKTIGKRFSNATATARTQIATDWRTHKGVRGKAKMLGKLAGATLISPVSASLATVTSAYKGLTSSLPGAIKYGYHKGLEQYQQRKLAQTETKMSPNTQQPGRVASIFGKIGIGLTRNAKLLQRKLQRQKTLNSLNTQRNSVKKQVNIIANKINSLKSDINEKQPLLQNVKHNKNFLKQLKSLEKQKAILTSEFAFTESEKARKEAKYKTQNTRKMEKLENQLKRRTTRLNRTKESLVQNITQMKSVYEAPKAVFSGLVKSAYSPSKSGKILNKMTNKLNESGGIVRLSKDIGTFTGKLMKGFVSKGYKYSGLRYAVGKTKKGIESIDRAFTPNKDIKINTDDKLYNTLTRVGKLQQELDNSQTSTKRKLEIQKEMKPLKSEAYKLTKLQSKLAHHYNLKITKESIKIARLDTLNERLKKLNQSKFKDKINEITLEMESRNKLIEEYNKYIKVLTYNNNSISEINLKPINIRNITGNSEA